MLLEFRSAYGSVPRSNQQGKNITETDEFNYFSREAIRNVVRKLG
jgi:hypothetical protein